MKTIKGKILDMIEEADERQLRLIYIMLLHLIR